MSPFFLSNQVFERPNEAQENMEFDNGMSDHIFEDTHMILDAKIDEFLDVNDVEEESDIIVVATKVYQNEPTIQRDPNGNLMLIYTLSDVKIDTVISGEIEENSTVSVLENTGYDPVTKRTYHIAGYELMKMDTPYLLFLRKSETADNYIPSGVTFGKVPIMEETSTLQQAITETDTDYAKTLIEEYKHLYKIQDQAIEKYKEYLE